MNKLTENWKNGEIEFLDDLIKQIEEVDNSRSLSDEYLKAKKIMTREECGVAVEYPYGIVTVISDYVLPYLKELKELKKNRDKLAYDLGVADTKNGELLRLLKGCKEYLSDVDSYFTKNADEAYLLLTKVKKVLK